MKTTARWMPILALAALAWAVPTLAQDAAAETDQQPETEPFRLNLPEWNPDPEDLPPELRPLDVVRPVLPDDVAAEVADLEARIAEIEGSWLELETREAQDAMLDEAIGLAERVLALRVEHQGNAETQVRWRDAAGEASEWHEVIVARQKVADLRRYRGLDAEGREAIASVDGTDAEVMRLYGEGKYAEAQAVTERQLEVRRRVLGDEHPSTLTSISNMGILHNLQGKLAEAEPYYREALKRSRRELGDEHPRTLETISNMGFLFYSQGRFTEATPYIRESLEGSRRVLGDEHPSTLEPINLMGILLYSQGRVAEAEPYWHAALDARIRVLGKEHPDTLVSISNMSALLAAQGRLFEAEPYYREALDIRRRVMGDEHPQTFHSISSMGYLLESQGRLSEAEPYYREALDGRRRILGDEHPDTLHSTNNLGSLLRAQGKLSEAEPYHRETLEARRRILGDEHPDTIFSINNLGDLLRLQGRLAEAEPYTREAREGFRRVLGDEHPHTLTSINNMGGLLWLQGRLTEAEQSWREALEGRQRVLGVQHPNTLTSINNIGSLMRSQGRLSEAEQFWREALEGRQRVLGAQHPLTLQSVHNLGDLLRSLGHIAQAEPYHRESLVGFRRVLGGEHQFTLTSINNMGALLSSQGKPAEAEPYYREALATAERLRVTIDGDASARAQFAGALNLTGIAMNYARTLLALERDAEALGVLERGRGRAGLDLFAGGRSAAEQALRATADPDRLARYDAALAGEAEAQLAVTEAEARLTAAPDADKPARRDEMLAARRTLSERTASVFAELRGLVPAVDPMTSAQMLAALRPGEALVTWAWTDDGIIALVARDGEVTGVTLAENREETSAFNTDLQALRGRIAKRPVDARDALSTSVLGAARDAAAPEALRDLLAGAASVIAVTDGPLSGVPIELLLPDVPVAYAPTATIALRPRLGGAAPTRLASSGGVIVGDPVFAGGESRPEPEYPDAGIVLAMVADDSNAAVAGLTRGDVLLAYGDYTLASAADLGPAIGATAEAMATRGVSEADRPVTARVWRLGEDGQGEEIEVKLALGRMGVQMDQRPPAASLRSMATFDRSADSLAANATALEQIRFYGGGLSPLPNTRLEAAAIASMLGEDATLLMGADATAPRLREAVESAPPRVIHLATHGLLGTADRPLLASVALSTPDEPTGEDNGFVTLGDILSTWGGQLRNTELVTLSACDTASAVRQGDTMMALPLGLLISGADTVVASLWKVDDKATALLMARFYSNWLGKSGSAREIDGVTYASGDAMPKLAALREAQQWLRGLTRGQVDAITGSPDAVNQSVTRDPSPRRGRLVTTPDPDAKPYDHPFYWSAFVLYGSPE